MILSFHPLFAADRQIICAGRAPGPDERQAISAATAVILPQACRQDLYEMVRENCALYFPNYDARFAYPGKTGQLLLFKRAGVPHPRTVSFSDTRAFQRQCRRIPDDLPFGFPCVFKFDWGGEGETVFPVDSESRLKEFLVTASAFERTGQDGFSASGNDSRRQPQPSRGGYRSALCRLLAGATGPADLVCQPGTWWANRFHGRSRASGVGCFCRQEFLPVHPYRSGGFRLALS